MSNLVRFGQLLDPIKKKTIFKIPFSRNSKSSVWNPYEILTYSTRQAIPKNPFVLHFTYTGDTPYGVWFNLNNFSTQWITPIFKNPFSRKKFRMKYYFFTRQAIATTLFVLHSTYTGDTPCRVLLHLDNSMTQSKRTIFEIRYSRNSKSSVWNPYETLTFSIGKQLQKLFLSYTLPTQGILHAEFGSVWTTIWLNQKELYLKFANREVQKVP